MKTHGPSGIHPVPGFPGSFYDANKDEHFRVTDMHYEGDPRPRLPPVSDAERDAVEALRRSLGVV